MRKGFSHSVLVPTHPKKNGIAEQKNHHLLDVARTLLLESSVPPQFWVEALSTAVYLINRLPSQTLSLESPYFRLYHQHPPCRHLQTFSCVCFLHLHPLECHKLSTQFVKCAFMGYSPNHKGFVCYDSSSKKFRVSRNVVFFDQFSSLLVISPSLIWLFFLALLKHLLLQNTSSLAMYIVLHHHPFQLQLRPLILLQLS